MAPLGEGILSLLRLAKPEMRRIGADVLPQRSDLFSEGVLVGLEAFERK